MKVVLIAYPIRNLGPGDRIGIWTAGCHKNCPNCMSEYSKSFDPKFERTIDDIVKELKGYIEKNNVDGITISGGEPFDQEELLDLVIEIKKLGINDILIYTGYVLEEMEKWKSIIDLIGVLIDGPYIDELNDNYPLRGSSNQRIFILKKELEPKYLEYLKQPRKFDFYFGDNYYIVIGILPKGANSILKKI